VVDPTDADLPIVRVAALTGVVSVLVGLMVLAEAICHWVARNKPHALLSSRRVVYGVRVCVYVCVCLLFLCVYVYGLVGCLLHSQWWMRSFYLVQTRE
jgi:hypothetical protein